MPDLPPIEPVAPPDPDRPWEVVRGRLPVVLHVPHAGTWIPRDERETLRLDDATLTAELVAMTDHHTDVLARPAIEAGAHAIVNRLSRLVCDPERFPDDREPMEAAGMGFAYQRTSAGALLRQVDATVRARIRARWFDPYTAAVAELVRAVREEHGRCLVIDLHSYPSRRLAYERGGIARPDVCLGTDERHTPGWLRASAIEACERRGLWWDLNTPFSGVYVPSWAHGTDRRVSAVMLEIRRDVYLDEATLELDPGGTYLVGDLVREVASGLEVGDVELPDGTGGFLGAALTDDAD